MAVLNRTRVSGSAPPLVFPHIEEGTRLAAAAAMGTTPCASCNQNVPDFARVCEHCGLDPAQRFKSSLDAPFETDLPFEDLEAATPRLDGNQALRTFAASSDKEIAPSAKDIAAPSR